MDLQRGVLVIRMGKAHRVDEISLHADLAAAFSEAGPGLPGARVFGTTVTKVTRRKDFKRAKIPLIDGEGRHADLHSLRVSLGTQLARAGVAPQVAQRVMRHADYRTTLKHYTSLGLSDDASALAQIAGPSSTPSSQGTQQDDSVLDAATEGEAAAGA